MYKINERVKIRVCRLESNFDRASDTAYERACSIFGVDDDGHCRCIENWDRSTDMIVVEFESYQHTGSMAGQTHIYTFVAWTERNEE